MVDKLTRKRVKVDYERMIIVLGLTHEFTSFLFRHRSKISIRRSALAFLRSKKVNIPYSWHVILDNNLRSNFELLCLAQNANGGDDLDLLFN